VAPNLPIGHYTVSAEKTGFKKAAVPPIEMNLKARVRADPQLQVAKRARRLKLRPPLRS
jgi:hypothetical protein